MHGRDQPRALQRQIGLAHLGGGGQHGGIVVGVAALGGGFGRIQLRTRGAHGGLRGNHGVLRGLGLGLGVVEFFLANGTGGGQRAAAVHVVLAARGIGLQAREVGLLGGHLRHQRCIVGVQRAGLAHDLRELRFGLRQRDQRICRVQLHQQQAGLHVVGVVCADAGHGAGDLGCDLHHVAAHIGVVGGLIVARHHPVIAAPGNGSNHNGGSDDAQAFLAATRVSGGLDGCCGW
ncbi:hypothetical protein SDC9_125937 [bioreactor metagenome]|uniref:Uncharacterized protein n=1 Tax=bioreactor metagenome TaxID=1076179 RepID=A0A645CQC6_9ZZZZ